MKAKKTSRTRSISQLIRSRMLFIITVTLIVIALISCFIEYLAITKSTKQALEVQTDIAAERIEWVVKSYMNIAEGMGMMQRLSNPDCPLEEKRAILDSKCEQYGLMRSKIINPDGYSDMDGMYRGDRDYFRKAIKGETVFSDVMLSKTDGSLTCVVAAPLWENGLYGNGIAGVVFASIDAKFLSDMIEEIHITDNTDAYIISSDSVVVASTNYEDVEKRISHISYSEFDSAYDILASIDRAALSGATGVITVKEGLRGHYYAVKPIGQDTGRYLVIHVPKADVLTPFHLSVMVWIATIVLIWGVIVLCSAKVADQIGNPFKEIAERLQRVAEGDLSSDVLVFGDTEETRIISNAARNLVGRLEYMVLDENEYKSQVTIDELIDVQTLRSIQEMVAVSTGLRTAIIDSEGLHVTSPVNSNDFCDRLTKATDLGFEKCNKCDRDGAYMAIEKGCCVSYECHAGLTNYAAPITLDGKYLGVILGGRVRKTEEIDEDKLSAIAESIGIDKKAYIKAFEDLRVWSSSEQQKIIDIIESFSKLLSTMIHNEYTQRMKVRKQDKRARYLSKVVAPVDGDALLGSKNISQVMNEFVNTDAALGVMEPDSNGIYQSLYEYLNDEISVVMENIYDIRELIYTAVSNIDFMLKKKNIDFVLNIDKEMPEKFLGDNDKFSRIVSRLLKVAAVSTDEGYVRMDVSAVRNLYATYVKIKVRYSGGSAENIPVDKMRSFFGEKNYYSPNNHTAAEMDVISLAGNIRDMNGVVEIKENTNAGNTFVLAIPQLEFMAS